VSFVSFFVIVRHIPIRIGFPDLPGVGNIILRMAITSIFETESLSSYSALFTQQSNRRIHGHSAQESPWDNGQEESGSPSGPDLYNRGVESSLFGAEVQWMKSFMSTLIDTQREPL
jgi:hypothetical protein